METEASSKTRRLILILEILALLISGLLVLIDYRLKQDLLKLFGRIEAAIETANGIYSQDPDVPGDSRDIRGGSVVADYASMETATPPAKTHANGAGRKPANRRTTANGGGGARSTQVPEPSE